MKKFNHKNIIKKYSSNLSAERKSSTGKIINGRLEREIKTFKCLCALMDMSYEQQQNISEFYVGDKVAYFIKGQEYKPEINDILILNSGRKYILKEEFDTENISDYVYFKARRIVDD